MTKPIRAEGDGSWLRGVISGASKTQTHHGLGSGGRTSPVLPDIAKSLPQLAKDVKSAQNNVVHHEADVARYEMALENARQLLEDAVKEHAVVMANYTHACQRAIE
jgi:hypothetical protein